MKELRRIFRRCIAATLCCAMLLQSTCVYAAGDENSVSHTADTSAPSVKTYENNGTEVEVSDDSTDSSTNKNDNAADNGASDSTDNVTSDGTDNSMSGSADNGTSGGADNSTSDSTPADFSAVYADGRIRIWNAAQLAAIGSGEAVTSTDNTDGRLGQGTPVTDADGAQITYSPDAQYQLVNDIPLTAGSIWNLPAGFTGSFTSSDGSAVTKDAPLYDSATDTIYVYNSYQLDLICSENAAEEPVMSNDMIAEEFGMGQLVYPDGTPADGDAAAQSYLTYGPDHNYVLAMEFTAKRPELKAEAVVYGDGENLDGRQYEGQVLYHDENGKEYILIGTKQQLQIIGKTHDKDLLSSEQVPYEVTEPIWKVEARRDNYIDDDGWYTVGTPEIYYPGDADLVGDFANTSLYSVESEKTLGNREYVGEGLEIDLDIDRHQYRYTGSKFADPADRSKGLTADPNAVSRNINAETPNDTRTAPTYSTWANYIIFRNINLENEEWTPLMFSGYMEGRLNMAETGNKQVTISNVNVKPATTKDSFIGFPVGDEKLDTSRNIGIGFFGTIGSSTDIQDIGKSSGIVTVKDIALSSVTVKNDMTETADTTTVVSGVLSLVGGLLGVVGGLLDLVTGGLGTLLGWITGKGGNVFKDVSLKDLLTGLFDIRSKAPDTFATGGFAGRIIGDVEVSGCDVTGLTISNLMDMTGGFVGNVEGMAEYKGLSAALGATVDILSGILNLLPGLGLGDLITFLLDNPDLLDVKTLIPTGYKQAKITNCSVSVTKIENADDKKFAGGFAGVQTGSTLTGCTVRDLESVSAEKYAGGFAGLTRDAVIKGLLEELDIQIVDIAPSSNTVNCTVTGKNLTVTSKSDYAGGFTGAVANSKLDGASVQSLTKVEATNNYAGGIAGRTTIGYGPSLAEADEADRGLLGTVSELLGAVTSGTASDNILNLVGVKPAELTGCTVFGDGFEITAKNYAGGLFGQGDGTILKGDRQNSITGVKYVHAKTDYAGGLAGSIATASAVGVINNTVGVGKMLAFEANNVTITGYKADADAGEQEIPGFTVEADCNYAGGAFGRAIGGSAGSIAVKDLYKVTSSNYAGGFAGSAGTGSLASAGGLDILGLGVVEIKNLLSVAQAVILKVDNCSVSGQAGVGCTVETTGSNNANETSDFLAGGFVGQCCSAEITNSSVNELKAVISNKKDGYAGGFIASSYAGGLADITGQTSGALDSTLISLESLLSAVDYLIPQYTNCTVGYSADPDDAVQVDAAVAGGFVADMTGGVIDNSGLTAETAAVTGIQNVQGTYFAGGFAGRVTSGGLAESGGLSLLEGLIDVNSADQLLGVLEVYIPEIHSAPAAASEMGLIVKALESNADGEELSENAGSAGGYLGYGSGVTITDSGVTGLRTTTVTPPEILDQTDGGSYFGKDSSYAVTAPRYAGGYAGKLDIGNAASVGGGLELLDSTLKLSSLADALAVVATKITRCDVSGQPQGFSVRANGSESTQAIGMAGGYVGRMCGAQINDSDVHSFEYIIGQEAAGGYVGTLEPGDVADVIDKVSILNGLITINNFLSVVQSFVPYIRNSSTDTVPCGGAVRAENGYAGGYAGHSLGGQIFGYVDPVMEEDPDQPGHQIVKEDYGTPAEAAAYRIRSVYGLDYAGGFTGLMETASVADTGSLSILGDLVNLDNPLTVAQGVYPIEENTAVYGPLSHVDVDTWNKWVAGVGSNGPFGNEFTQNDQFGTQEELDSFLSQYIYGYHVTAPGRAVKDGERENGSAGGYVGKMLGGEITNGNAHDLQKVTAWRGAGGYAGEMEPGSAASVGGLKLGDLTILNTSSVNLLETFVPAIKTSDVEGYSSGYTVTATGTNTTDKKYDVGYAGGYVGHMTGGQIWGAENETDGTVNHCSATGVRRVTGTASVGGFAGMTEPGTTLTADTKTESGLLNQILGLLLDSEELLDILPAMVATIRYADVSAWDDYGYTVSGAYNDGSDNTRYADSAGGFVGRATGTVFGEQVLDEDGTVVINEQAGVSANGVRNVTGGRNAGGFIGKSSAAGVAEVADSDESDESTTLLDKVLGLKGIEILDIFRTYVYASHVSGSADSGLEVTANEGSQISDENDALVYDGNAGGFAGSLLSGDTHQCTVTGLRAVKGINFTGGFTGYMGKTGLVDASGVDVLDKLLGLGVGVADVIGCQAEDCTVTGFGTEKADQEEEGVKVDSASAGFTVTSSNAAETKAEIAGGFVGYANLGRMTNDHVYGLKQVSSGETAGGFVGRTSHAYLAEVTLGGVLVQLLADVLNVVLDKILGVDNIENIGLIKIDLGIIKLDALCEGNLVSLTLLGLPITIALEKDENTLLVTIGDSMIKWGYTVDEDGHATVNEKSEIKVNLIKANRSKADGCSVVGVPDGYDVYGGGAGNGSGEVNKGTGDNGFAGGFVGYNDEGLLENNTMLFADVIRGTKDRVGPFSGRSSNKSVFPSLDGVEEVEQDGNTYRIYRVADPTYTKIIPSSGTGVKNSGHQSLTSGDHNWEVYTIDHMTDSGVKYFTELNGAKLHSTESEKTDIALQAYMDEGAKAVLMLDSPTETTPPSDTPEPPEQQDPCETTIRLTVNKVWKDGGDIERRKEITLTIWQEKKGVTDSKKQYGESITLMSADAVNDNIWQKVIKDLPVYEPQADGTKVYYIYTVTEAELGDYETKIEYSDDGYTVTITNSLPWHGLLPDSGGMGTRLLYLAGILLVMGAALSYIRSRCRMAEAAAGNGRPGSPGGRRRVRRRQRIHDRHSRR